MILISVASLRHSHKVHVDLAVSRVRIVAIYVRFLRHDLPIVLDIEIVTIQHLIQLAVVVRRGTHFVKDVSAYKDRSVYCRSIIVDIAFETVPSVDPIRVPLQPLDLI